jgi:hypothetical protein
VEHQRREEQPQAVAERPGDEEQQRRGALDRRAEAVAEHLVGGIELAAEVER